MRGKRGWCGDYSSAPLMSPVTGGWIQACFSSPLQGQAERAPPKTWKDLRRRGDTPDTPDTPDSKTWVGVRRNSKYVRVQQVAYRQAGSSQRVFKTPSPTCSQQYPWVAFDAGSFFRQCHSRPGASVLLTIGHLLYTHVLRVASDSNYKMTFPNISLLGCSDFSVCRC
uniref:Uncharacterized protein n=1 Tax=Timema monikensis TaxID=170555 RepID=A0A7R9EGH3_9NEOP|nr:unnamed protein product [Timema monikensis]